MDGGGQISIKVRSSASVQGVYPGTQIATQSFVSNGTVCRSATAADQISAVRCLFIVRVLPNTVVNLRDTR